MPYLIPITLQWCCAAPKLGVERTQFTSCRVHASMYTCIVHIIQSAWTKILMFPPPFKTITLAMHFMRKKSLKNAADQSNQNHKPGLYYCHSARGYRHRKCLKTAGAAFCKSSTLLLCHLCGLVELVDQQCSGQWHSWPKIVVEAEEWKEGRDFWCQPVSTYLYLEPVSTYLDSSKYLDPSTTYDKYFWHIFGARQTGL